MTSESVAYRLRLKLENFTGEAAGHLLQVNCEHCGQLASCDAAFPLVRASDFPGCTRKLNPNKPGPFLSWGEFRSKVIEQSRIIYDDASLELLPGGALGPIEIEPIGMWPKILKDIDFASPGGLLFSRALIDKLEERGVHLSLQLATLQNRKGFSLPYGIMQPRVFRKVVHPATFARAPHYRNCEFCEEITVLNPWPKPPAQIFLRDEFRERTGDLFRVGGFYGRCVFVSDRLKEALVEVQPTGLELEPFGVWLGSQ